MPSSTTLKLPALRPVLNGLSEAELAIVEVKAAIPQLGVFGMNLHEERDFAVEEVATAIAFLRQCRKLKRPNHGSYYLKHVAERWGCDNGMQAYVTNGALIVAAVFLGFVVEWEGNYGLNVGIAIADRDVKRLDPSPRGL